MSAIDHIKKAIAPELDTLHEVIMQQLRTANPLMNRVVETYLRTKGKLIRPIVVILTAKMLGTLNDRVMNAAAAVELLHNASLIHDDVVDDSKVRRNQPTINAVWDNHVAVLVGDFFVSSAMQQAIATADIRVIDALCHLGKLLSLGEIDQIYNAHYHHLTEDAYFRIINYKTASLFVACARMGCFAAGVDETRLDTMSRFAELLGLCFQIRDDIFDYFPSDDVGKPTGNDLREGKITLPLLHVLEDTTLPQHDAMLKLAYKDSLDTQEIAVLTEYTIRHGGIEYAYLRMQQLRQQAMEILATFPDTPERKAFEDIFDYIIARRY
ncbi:MAG: polyprenyl synthetase family protein [Muribaculaceae bacterium]|nr:polyprenyl synthetase family protein [Muribaculaceae bacterium]